MIVADTHSWLWWLTDRALLSTRALETLNAEAVAISTITFWEVATLVRRRRIELTHPVAEWLKESVERSSTVVIDLTLDIAVRGGLLDAHAIGDPADRIITATALVTGAPLVTKDRKIAESGAVTTIW